MIHPGIDLGTTYSMIGHVNAYGQPALFPDLHDASQFRTPSAVHLGARGAFVGSAAEDLLEESAEAHVLRFLKPTLADAAFSHRDLQGRSWTAPALVALLLRKMIRDARAFAGEDIGSAVITVPAHFTDEQRRATLRAARLAGLADTRLIEEPVAAAVYYGQAEGGPDERTLMVYDFGGGTFDVTLLQVSPQGLYVLATDGDAQLGGRSVDEALMAIVEDRHRMGGGVSLMDDLASIERLRRCCEEAKLAFSRSDVAHVRRPLLLRSQAIEASLSRNDFGPIAAAAVERSLVACDRCLSAAGIRWSDLDRIMLTGGSALLPGVRAALEARLEGGRDRIVLRQPHQAVAFGAALMADRFARAGEAMPEVQQATGCDLALKVWHPEDRAERFDILVARNMPLPASHERVLLTTRHDQANLTLEFAQLRGDPPEAFSLGAFTFGPIAAPRLHYPVRLSVRCDAEGFVHVAARDDETGRELELMLHERGGAADHAEERRLVNSVTLAAS